MWFWEGERATATSGYFVRITPEVVLVGAGCHTLNSTGLAAYRRAIGDPVAGPKLASIVAELRAAGDEVGEVGYKRTPPGYAAADGAEELLLHRSLHAHHEERADARLHDARIVERCVAHWRRMTPLHRWVMEHVGS